MPRRNWIRYAAVFALGLTVAAAGFYSLGLTGTGLAGAYSPSYAAVAMTFKGEYVKGDYYQPGDVVTFSGSTYVAQAETLDDPFSGPWTMLAQAGPAGPQGPKGDPGDPGSSPWSAGWEKVEKEVELPVWAAPTTATVYCPSTKRFVSGGWTFKYSWQGHRVSPQTQSITEPNGGGVGAGYQMTFLNNGSTKDYVLVYAICVNA